MNQQEYYYICPCIAENTDDQYKSLQFLTFTRSENRSLKSRKNASDFIVLGEVVIILTARWHHFRVVSYVHIENLHGEEQVDFLRNFLKISHLWR